LLAHYTTKSGAWKNYVETGRAVDTHKKPWGEFLLTAFTKFIVAILQRLGIIKTGRGCNRNLSGEQPFPAWLHDLVYFKLKPLVFAGWAAFFLRFFECLPAKKDRTIPKQVCRKANKSTK